MYDKNVRKIICLKEQADRNSHHFSCKLEEEWYRNMTVKIIFMIVSFIFILSFFIWRCKKQKKNNNNNNNNNSNNNYNRNLKNYNNNDVILP